MAARNRKKKEHSKKECKVAASILTEIIVRELYGDGMEDMFSSIYKEYNLQNDPFTGLPCTAEEYADNKLEYERQVMDESYGHHDGLD